MLRSRTVSSQFIYFAVLGKKKLNKDTTAKSLLSVKSHLSVRFKLNPNPGFLLKEQQGSLLWHRHDVTKPIRAFVSGFAFPLQLQLLQEVTCFNLYFSLGQCLNSLDDRLFLSLQRILKSSLDRLCLFSLSLPLST